MAKLLRLLYLTLRCPVHRVCRQAVLLAAVHLHQRTRRALLQVTQAVRAPSPCTFNNPLSLPSSGLKVAVPEKRRRRLLQELADIEKNIRRQR